MPPRPHRCEGAVSARSGRNPGGRRQGCGAWLRPQLSVSQASRGGRGRAHHRSGPPPRGGGSTPRRKGARGRPRAGPADPQAHRDHLRQGRRGRASLRHRDQRRRGHPAQARGRHRRRQAQDRDRAGDPLPGPARGQGRAAFGHQRDTEDRRRRAMTTTSPTELVGTARVSPPATTAMRVPPHDLEAEQAVLGGILIDPDAITLVRDLLAPEDFYAEKHTQLYRAAAALADRGDPIDAVTLRDQLERGPGVGRAGGLDYIAELTLTVPSAASVKHYAEIVVAHALRRRLIQAGGELSRLGFDMAGTAQDALDNAEQTVFRIGESHRN